VWTALRRLDSLLERAIAAAELIYGPAAARDPFRGLHISLDEVASLLRRAPGVPLFTAQDHVRADQPDEIGQRLGWLARTYALSPFEIDAILICLAPELDLRYERLYGYLQDDVTKKRPTVDLVLNLLCVDAADRLARRRHFAADSALVRRHLLRLVADPSQVQPPLLSHYLKLDERIVDFLLGSDEIDSRLASTVNLVVPDVTLDALWLPSEVRRRLVQLIDGQQTKEEGLLLYFQGSYGVGKQSTAEALCRKLGLRLLVVDGERILQADDLPFDMVLRLVCREADLQQAAIYWQGFDAMLTERTDGVEEHALRDAQRDALVQVLAHRSVAFLAGTKIWEPAGGSRATRFVRVEFPKPAHAERLLLWQTSLNGASHDGVQAALPALAARFRFSGGQIHDATATAHNLARWRDPENGHVAAEDLYAASRLQSSRKLNDLAQKITPRTTWDDIVLPADRMQQLQELCNQLKYRAVVYDQWGFGRKLTHGAGLSALFTGPSGTGKTMAAEIIAAELGLDLYRIDLAAVVSKYIGETEKNLERIFSAAADANAVLFFDEADALFGKRSEVRDAHDRYANIEIAYLLQRVESYEGLVILATNLRQNMDDAFVRRLQFIVDFPFPDEAHRRRIWQVHFPDETPRRADVDLGYLAQRFRLAGGNIKNIVVSAAFLAAADGGAVTMGHLLHATRREHQKMGKVLTEAELAGPAVTA
jgi:SpoVK/Ycf46/Vps4 family AAA+-type ATPase